MSFRVAITGATGFLGRYLVRAAADRGWSIRILARRRPVHPQLADIQFEAIPGDLEDKGAIAALVVGADAVIHAAGAIRGRGTVYSDVNVAGTSRLAGAVAATGARFVLVSSLAARIPHLSAYARSKRESEDAAVAVLGQPNSWAIIRPTAIYGPWDNETLPLFKVLRRRVALVPGRPYARVTVVHVEDAAQATLALAGPGAANGLFELTDDRPEGYTWHEIAAAATMGSPTRPIFVPPLILSLSAGALGLASFLTRADFPLSPGKMRELLHVDWRSDPARQVPSSLFRPGHQLIRGFEETIAWYCSAGLLASR